MQICKSLNWLTICLSFWILCLNTNLTPRTAVHAEKYQFETEVAKVMDILIHSVYKSKEVFLRELISNASDAVDKLRFFAVTDKSILEGNNHLNITIDIDSTNKILSITDSGIGMNEYELKNNLGTIAKSGTADFIKAVKSRKEGNDLIGKFGVGFYSVFLVADKVQVVTHRFNDKSQYIWESSDAASYEVYEDTKGPILARGTTVKLYLKPDATEFLDSYRMQDLVRKYSEFVDFPIYVSRMDTVDEKVPLTEEEIAAKTKERAEKAEKKKADKEKAEAEKAKAEEEMSKSADDKKSDDKDADVKDTDVKDTDVKDVKDADVKDTDVKDTDEKKEEDEDEMKMEDLEEDEEDKESEEDLTTKTIKKEVKVWDHVNTNKPIWMRAPKEVTKEEHVEFYKSYFREWQDPMTQVHFRGEGNTNFRALIYIPSRPPMDLNRDSSKIVRNIKLFVRRVFITDELLDFMPPWLSFVKGIIDSDDFPLNVSRETVQKTKLLNTIKSTVVSKVLRSLHVMSKNETEYSKFYSEFSNPLKVGVMSDSQNKEKLIRLLRFSTTKELESENATLTNMDDYVSRMRKGQKGIYVLTGTDLKQMRKSPYLEALNARGYEVLLMDDPYDEYLLPAMPKYDDISLIHINKGKLEFGDEDETDKDAEKKVADEFQPLTTWLTDLLKTHVDKTVVSNRLTTSAVALVAPKDGVSGYMRQILSAQQRSMDPFQRSQLEQAMKAKQTLEVNPKHPIMIKLLKRIEEEKANDDDTKDLARSLYDLALIRGGYPLGDATNVSRRLENAVRLGLTVGMTEEAEVDVKAAPEVDEEAALKVKQRIEKEEKEVEQEEKGDVNSEVPAVEKESKSDAPGVLEEDVHDEL